MRAQEQSILRHQCGDAVANGQVALSATNFFAKSNQPVVQHNHSGWQEKVLLLLLLGNVNTRFRYNKNMHYRNAVSCGMELSKSIALQMLLPPTTRLLHCCRFGLRYKQTFTVVAYLQTKFLALQTQVNHWRVLVNKHDKQLHHLIINQRGCKVGRLIMANGDTWENESACEECVCSQGKTHCAPKSCPVG